MLIDHMEMERRGLVFWDEARSGEFCAIPCWPVDARGDAYDCEDSIILVGVLGDDGLFRAEETPVFDPKYYGYICSKDGGPSIR